MKKVLIISYYWPPAGGPGVQRILKLVKYLPELGWEPVILTVRNGDYQALDPSLAQEIPPGIKVYKSTILEPYAIYRKMAGIKSDASIDIEVHSNDQKSSFKQRLIGFIWKNFFIPDAKIGWIPFGIWRGWRVARKEKVHAILSTSPPYTVSVIARWVKILSGKKWMADFRDPWTGYLTSPDRKFLAAWYDKMLERKTFKYCHKFTAAWPGIIDNFHAKFPNVDLSKTKYIPNGFDFDLIPEVYQKSERFILTYSGSMYGKRYPKIFIEHLGEILRENPELKSHFVLQMIGRLSEEIENHLSEHIGEGLQVVSYLPHNEMLRELKKTTALWLVMDDVPDARDIVAGKTYEYIGQQKPIFACLPDNSQSEKIITETNTGTRIDILDKMSIQTTLLEWFQRWKEGKPIKEFNHEEIRKYHRKQIAQDFAELLSEMVKT